MKNSLTRLSRQGLTHSLLLARLLVSGLWPASVQPALPILLAGLTLSTAAQAQQRTPLPAPTVTLDSGDRQLTANWEAVANAASYELQWKSSSYRNWSGRGLNTVNPATSGTVLNVISNNISFDVRVRAKAATASTTHVDSEWSSIVRGVPRIPAFSVTGPATIAEDAGTATYTVSLSGKPRANVTINYATADGRGGGAAKAGLDYNGTRGTLTFTSTNWKTAQTVDVTITDDTVVDEDETFTFTLSNPGGTAVLSASRSLTTTITDSNIWTGPRTPLPKPDPTLRWIDDFEEDEEPIYEITQTSFVVEWDGMKQATHFEATATPIDSQGVSGTPVSVSPWPSKGVSEYGVLTKTWEAVFKGLTPNTTYTVLIEAIAGDEYIYTFTRNGWGRFRASSRYTSSEASITVTTLPMKSRLPAPTVTLEVGDTQLTANWEAVVNEEGTTYALQWKASSVTSWTAATGVTTIDPATTGTVITGLTNGTTYDVRVRSKAAPSSRLHLDGEWSSAVQGVPTDNATFSVTGPATVAENAGTATYTVTLSAEPAANVTVEYATSDVTATAGADYTAKSGTLTFTPTNWDTAQTVPVTITDDAVDDDDETFTFTLSNPSAGTVLWSTAPSLSTTITDDDTLGLTYTAAPTTLTVDTPITALTATAMSFTGTLGYAVTTGSLPAGLNINATTGAINGTPTAANTSTTTVTVTATAGTQTATADITFPAVGKGTLATPANLAVKPNTLAHTTFTVTWGAVANAAGYTATAVQGSNSFTGTVSVPSSGPEAEFTGLPANTAYTVSVTATGNANYNNSAAATQSVTTLKTPAFTLTAPRVLIVHEEAIGTTYTVELAAQPTGTVTVAMAAQPTGDLIVSPASLTFTATTWSTAQTVTVRATSDDDVQDDRAVISHTASGGGYGSVTGSVSVTVFDDDIRGVTVSKAALTVLEGGASESYTVVLDTQPTGDVTVTVGGTTNSDVSVSPASLTFTATTWSTAQTVTVAAATDTDAANDAVVTLTHAVSGADYDSKLAEVPPSVAVTIIEKDTATFSVSGPATVAEDAGTATYTVSLSKQPSGNVTVKYATADGTATAGSDYTAARGTLTFTQDNWSTNQTVSVTITDDTVDDDEEDFTFTLSEASTRTSLSASPSVATTITDNDDPVVTVSFGTGTYSVTEGGTVSVAVTLSADPERLVTIPLTATNGTGATSGDYSVVPSSVTFVSPETSQTLTFSATDDAVDEDNETVTLGFGTLPPRLTAGTTSQAAVTIMDDDSRGLMLSATSLTVNENAFGTYTVALRSQPTTNVTVTVGGATGDVSVDTSTETGNQNTLTFTPTNWSTAQTVTVAAADDDDAVTDTAVMLTHTASGGDYASLTGPSVTVTITENDSRGMTLSTTTNTTITTLTVNEEETESYTVVLNSEPTGDVTVTIGGTDNTDITVDTSTATGNQNTLTFTPTNWSTAQTVMVSATEDADTADDRVTLSHTVTGGDYGSVTGNLEVRVDDNDSPGLVFEPPTALTVDEDGSATYTVALATQPEGNVTVTVGGTTNSDVTVDTDTDMAGAQDTLTFSNSNWDTPQTVTVSAANDADATDDSVTLTHTTTGYNSVSDNLMVTITENDSRGVTLSTTTNTTITTLTVNEEETESYTVVLNSEPTGDVTVTIGGTDNTDITVDTDPATTGDQTTLTFTPTNWSTARMVTVKAADDDDAVNDAAVTLTHTASGGDYASLTGPSLSVTITENDTRGVTLSTTTNTTITTLTVNEKETESYTVVLDSEPTGDVTVTIGGTDNTDITVDTSTETGNQNTLTFTPTNWSTPRMVMVAAADDDDAVNDAAVTLTHTASGGDYASLTGPSLSVTITENDSRGVTLSTTTNTTITTLTVNETETESYTVVLDSEPTGDVTVTIDGTDNTDITVDTSTETGNQTTLTFTPINWSTPRMVMVAAADDDDAVNDAAVTLTHTASGGDYASLTGPSLSVTIIENDAATFSATGPATIAEGAGTATYTVSLSVRPSANVTINYATADGTATAGSDYTAASGTLTFTPSNWDTDQMVPVTITDDTVDDDDETFTFTLSNPGGGALLSASPSLSTTITDNDVPALTVSFGATIPPQTWTVDVSVDLTLPEATGGNGTISYELTPDLPPGVMLDRSTRTLSGAPAAAATATTYTWRATDSDGNTAALSFSVTVSPAPNLEATLRYPAAPTTLTVGTTITPLPATTTGLTAPITYAVSPDLPAGLTLSTTTGEISGTPTTMNPDEVTVTVTATTDDGETATAKITFPPVAAAPPLTEEKRDEVNTEILPSIINQVAEKQVAIITGRSEFISSGLNRGNLSMEEMVTDVADYLFSHHQEIQANGFDWRQALSGKNFSFTLAETSTPQSGMDDGKPSSSGSGPLSFWGAIDYSSLQDKIETISLDGNTLSFNFGVDKEFTSDLVLGILLSIANSEFDLTGGFTGTYEVDLSTLNPYISWQASEDLSLWASVGYGRGQVDLTDDSTNPPVSERSDFTRFSAGGRFQLWQSETGTGLALKLDGTTAHFLGADVQRSRLATELSHDFSTESGVLNTALELGLLMSSADESAAELVGRLHWQGDAGLSGSIRSRVLLGGGDRQEWGIGGALHYTAGGDGEGLMMSLEPSFGISNPQLLPDLWQVTTSNPATTTAAPTARLNAKLAYGFPTTGGLLTPYTDFSFSDTTSTYGAGLRYGLSTGLDLDLKGTHKTTTMDDAENNILLELRSDL